MVLIDSYSESNYDGFKALASGSAYIEMGQAITMPGTSYKVTSVKFYLATTGSPEPCTVKIYNCTGTPGADGNATGSYIAESESKQFSRSEYALEEFTFTGDNQIILNANSNYTIELSHHGGSALKSYKFGYDSSSPTHAGNLCYHDADEVPGYPTGYDACFYLYGEILYVTNAKSYSSDILIMKRGYVYLY
jgi:hypothetical protein